MSFANSIISDHLFIESSSPAILTQIVVFGTLKGTISHWSVLTGSINTLEYLSPYLFAHQGNGTKMETKWNKLGPAL